MRDVDGSRFAVTVRDDDISTEGQIKYESLIREIAHLHALEFLQLQDYPLHVDWFHHFQNPHGLKSVCWIYTNPRRSESEDGDRDDDLQTALRQILPRSGDDIEVIIELNWDNY
jgi:hypothetical protein